jgi:hypothetical protein
MTTTTNQERDEAMRETAWGVGSEGAAKAFDTIQLHGRTYDLIFGELPHSRQDNNIYARAADGRIEGFDGHRLCWRVEVEESNYLKESELSGDEIRKGGSFKLYVDGECIYDGFCRSVESGMKMASAKMEQLGDVAGGDWLRAKTRDKMIGRPIFYHGVPAVITRLVVDQGCVIIEAAEGHQLRPPVYEDDPEDWLLDHQDGVKDDVTSPHIWWWRS